MLGLSLNKNQPIDKMSTVANNLSDKDYGHNKFLEHIYVWLLIDAPRYFWVDADTYRLSSKQSESSTTVLSKELTVNNFEDKYVLPETLKIINFCINSKNYLEVKKIIPEGWMQKREWCLNYKTLSNIIIQRKHHKLPHWPEFIKQTVSQLDHPELLEKRL
ncbi:MAG: hypothetical protein M0R17_02790 [Candidatus Omnitrophica bacterium]|nr:hypothetical protein [Candidatus Omnitrophota bacterium]